MEQFLQTNEFFKLLLFAGVVVLVVGVAVTAIFHLSSNAEEPLRSPSREPRKRPSANQLSAALARLYACPLSDHMCDYAPTTTHYDDDEDQLRGSGTRR